MSAVRQKLSGKSSGIWRNGGGGIEQVRREAPKNCQDQLDEDDDEDDDNIVN